MIDPALKEFLIKNGYFNFRVINNSICGLFKFLFTTGLFTKLDGHWFCARFCFESPVDAILSLHSWDGLGYPPGPWLKQKGPVEYHNPLLFEHKGGAHFEPYPKPIGDVWQSQGPREYLWV